MENKNTLGRLSLVPSYTVMKDTEVIPALMANGYDIRKTVALLEEPKEKPVSNGNTTLEIHWNKYTPNYRKAKIECGGAGFLRLSEVYYPGWEIKVDGKKTPIYRADGSWMAIAISEGSHTIEMYPKSLFLMQSAVISIALAILLILYWSIYAIRNKRTQKENI